MARILVLKPFAVSRLNGGEIALMERLALYRSWGHEIKIQVLIDRQGQMTHPDSYELMGLKIDVAYGENLNPHESASMRAYEEFFQKTISEFRPSLILTHYTDFFATSTSLQWDPERTWVDQTDDEYPRLQQMQGYGRLAQIYSGIRHFTVASAFLERSIKKSFPGSKIHLCPNLLSELQSLTKPNFSFKAEGPWVHVNPTAVKGIEFVLELAEKMPNEKFLLVGNWGTKFPDRLPPNVSTIERQESLASVFAKAKGVLMPSVWQEAFGRVPLEAMAYGVPVISSDRGALPETVGQGGIVLPLDLALWEAALRQGEIYWQHQVAAGWKRFQAYQAEVKRVYAALRDEFSMLK